VYSNEYIQLYDFACVSPCDSKAKIKYSVTQKFIASTRQHIYFMLIMLCFMLHLFSLVFLCTLLRNNLHNVYAGCVKH